VACREEHALCRSRNRNRPCITFAFNRGGCVNRSGRSLKWPVIDNTINRDVGRNPPLAKPLTHNEARRIAANIAKLPELLKPRGEEQDPGAG
jgi:hypothetical protein